MKHVRIELKFYNLDTFKKQIDVNFIDLDSELVDLNYKVASLIFCHFWRSIVRSNATGGSRAVTAKQDVVLHADSRVRYCVRELSLCDANHVCRI